jgi:hypothetical protein
MRFRILLFIVIALGSIHCSKKNSTSPAIASVEDLIIKDNEISGWRKSGEGWVASSQTELFTRIDGAAPAYIQNGFVESAEQSYSGVVKEDTVTVGLRVTDLGKDVNAKALFNELANGINGMISPETWQTDKFSEAKIERTQSIRILAWKSKYCISLNITSNLTEALDVLKTFASNVGSKIK